MKDQASVDSKESKEEKHHRAMSLFLESLYKPDNELRSCAHNQKCYNELMEIRETVIEYVLKDLRLRGYHNKGPLK
tara:strand:+ start:848 stop:1075 length:228 start_codon:yes stop_codon:yes gene_type:complete